MEESKVIRAIGDVTRELEGIGGGLKSLADTDKKYFDETLGSVIKEAIVEVLTKMSVSEAGKNYYHNELIEKIKSSVTEVIDRISDIRLDMSPVLQIAKTIAAQNKETVNAIMNMPKPETNDGKYQELMLFTVGIIEKNNELLTRLIEKQQEVKPIDITPREKLKIEFKVTGRDQYNGKIDTFLAVEK